MIRMNYLKIILLGGFLVPTLFVFFERASFVNGNIFMPISMHIIFGRDDLAIKILSNECKASHGDDTVLEIIKTDSGSYARCGTFWPFADHYEIVKNGE